MSSKTKSANHIIEVKNLVKRYKKSKINAVDNVSFYVEEGSFFSLLGPNGAGKTTAISILTTILSKTVLFNPMISLIVVLGVGIIFLIIALFFLFATKETNNPHYLFFVNLFFDLKKISPIIFYWNEILFYPITVNSAYSHRM